MRCHLQSSECAGRLEFHHAIKQQRLRREFKYGAWRHMGEQAWRRIDRYGVRSVGAVEQLTLDDILGDTRNRIFLCSHHHELVTNGRVKVELPPSVWEFAAEFGLTAQLENDLRRAA